MGRTATCKHAESRGKHFFSALVTWLKRIAVLGVSACRGVSACPGNSKPQPSVTFQKKLQQDLAQSEGASKLPGGTDVSHPQEWLPREQGQSLPGGERKRRQR